MITTLMCRSHVYTPIPIDITIYLFNVGISESISILPLNATITISTFSSIRLTSPS